MKNMRITSLLNRCGAIFIASLLCLIFSSSKVMAQAGDVIYGDPVFTADFGTGAPGVVYPTFEEAGLSSLVKIGSLYFPYTITKDNGYDDYLRWTLDGEKVLSTFFANDYCIVSNTNDVRNATGLKKVSSNKITNNAGDNIYMVENLKDHTGNENGRFLLVNGSDKQGVVFARLVTELCKNAQFEFSVWIANAHSKANGGAKDGEAPALSRVQFELWADDPGQAVLVGNTNNDPATMISGTVYSLDTDNNGTADKEVKLLYKTAEVTAKGESETTKPGQIDVNATTSTNKYAVYVNAGGTEYAYEDADGFWHSTTNNSNAFAEGGSILLSSSYFQDVEVDAVAVEVDVMGTMYTLKKYDTYYALEKDGTLYNLTDALGGGELVFAEDIFAGATPIVDQSSIFNTQYTYKKDAQVIDVQGRWTQLKEHFTLVGQDYGYLVLRSSFASSTGNDFCIDDISFTPYAPFDLNVSMGGQVECEDGLVTLISSFTPGSSDGLATIEEYISDYGFQFQGKSKDDKQWYALGNKFPLQIQSITDNLELNIPIAEYLKYSDFRIVVASTPAGIGGKCVTINSNEWVAQKVATAPEFTITGDDICAEDGGTGTEKGVFVITKTSTVDRDNEPWQVTVRMSDGSIRTLVPAKCQ